MPAAVIINSLIPIFAVILAGLVFNRFEFPGKNFWPSAERLTYFVLFPALLFQSTATADIGSLAVGPLFLTLLAVIFLMVTMLLLLKAKLTPDANAFSSVFQGSIRFNTYVGFAIAFAIYDDLGLTWAAVTISLLIPLVNFLSVVVIVVGKKSHSSWASLLWTIIKTPPLLACLMGISFNSIGLTLPSAAEDFLKLFGRASLPLGLLTVGAGLQLATIGDRKFLTLFPVIVKLLILPAIMFFGCRLFNVDPVATAVAVLFAALPGSASSYILARQLGGDSSLMANIVTIQIAASLITLPLILAVFISL